MEIWNFKEIEFRSCSSGDKTIKMYQVMGMNKSTWGETVEREEKRAQDQSPQEELAKEVEKEQHKVGEKSGETNVFKRQDLSTGSIAT